MNVKQIVELMGGSCKLARSLGIKSQAISLWIKNNRIPLKRVPTLTRLAKEKGLPLKPEDLRADIDWDALRGGALDT